MSSQAQTQPQPTQSLGWKVPLTKACIIIGIILCLLAVFGVTLNYYAILYPFDITFFGEQLPFMLVFISGLSVIYAGSHPSMGAFGFTVAFMLSGVVAIFTMLINVSIKHAKANENAGTLSLPVKQWLWFVYTWIHGLISVGVLVFGTIYSIRSFRATAH